jgi:hypothetical protein
MWHIRRGIYIYRYEEEFGVLSEDFNSALISGVLNESGSFEETRIDFCRWKRFDETWLRRKHSCSNIAEGGIFI